MNFLAHAYLSFNDPDILAGNMISDFVKGKKKFDYAPRIQQGISLHRAIDSFTDAHAIVKKAKEVFRPAYRLYSGAFVDIVFDHFLALDKHEFPGESLLPFTEAVYESLDRSYHALPEVFQQLFPYMKQHNWLYNYRSTIGIEWSFGGIRRRARYISESNTAVQVFHKHYTLLEGCYSEFFPELKTHAAGIFTAMAA